MSVSESDIRTLQYRVSELETDIGKLEQKQAVDYKELARKLDRITWALVTLCLTIAGAAITFVLTAVNLGSG